MISILQTAVALVFIFAVLVMFHELGHYIAARRTGMRVEEFSFGFGPKLITLFKRGDTEYTIRPFPIGGFVKIAGMEPGQEDIPDGFQAQSIAKRALVIFSGPFASFLLAVLIFMSLGIFWGYPVGTTTNEVGMVSPQTEAARAGLRAGDRVVAINGIKVSTGKEMTDVIHRLAGQPAHLTVQRGMETVNVDAVPKWRIEFLGASWSFMNDNKGVAESVAEVFPAGKAGIMPGDEIVSVNGKPIGGGADMVKAISAAGSAPVKLTLRRSEKEIAVTAKPNYELVRFQGTQLMFPSSSVMDAAPDSVLRYQDRVISVAGMTITSGEQFVQVLRQNAGNTVRLVIGRDGEQRNVDLQVTPAGVGGIETSPQYAYGVLGFAPDTALVKTGLGESLRRGARLTSNLVATLIETLTTRRIKEDIGGPIMIAKAAQSSVARGFYDVLTLLGGLSMSLAFINLLPIPIVDGGHLALLAVERVRRKRLTEKQMAAVNAVGMVILLSIFVLVMSSDILKIMQRQIPQ